MGAERREQADALAAEIHSRASTVTPRDGRVTVLMAGEGITEDVLAIAKARLTRFYTNFSVTRGQGQTLAIEMTVK